LYAVNLNNAEITGEHWVGNYGAETTRKLVSDKYYRRNTSDIRGGPNAGN